MTYSTERVAEELVTDGPLLRERVGLPRQTNERYYSTVSARSKRLNIPYPPYVMHMLVL